MPEQVFQTQPCGGGSYTGEVSWSILDADGNVVAEGGATAVAEDNVQSFCIDPDAVIQLRWVTLRDGWNGNILTINGESLP